MYDQNYDTVGPVVSMVTSSASPHYPASAVVDGRPGTFWLTGGLYPQQLVISLNQAMPVSSITISCVDVRRLEIEASQDEDQPLRFKQLVAKELQPGANGHLQREQFRLPSVTATYLRLTIHEGYDHFAAIQSFTVQ